MNIAILIPELEGGGAERVASIIGNYYVGKGHNVYYFLPGCSKKCVYDVHGKIIHTEIMLDGKTPLYLLKAALIMRKYKMKYKIDVSVSFMELFNYINILSKGRDRVIIRICTILSQREDIEQSYLYNRNLLRSVYNRADRVVVMTDYAMKEMMAQYGIKRKKLVKIPNPVTNPERREEEEVWKYGEHTVVCVGRLEDVKQHNVAIRAFAMTAEKIPDARLLILGVGLNAAKLRSLIKSLKLEDKVQLLGFKKNINYYLEHAKVFLMTSKTEGFPNSMLEAMSVGVPVVSIDSPGAPGEILKAESGSHKVQYGIYGIVTPYINHHYLSKEPITDEERQLSDAVTELLMDEELWKRYAEASRKRAAMYNMEKIMNCWNRLIEKK